jgi:23S rRNA (cytosine1962-C5)-methyltransferase
VEAMKKLQSAEEKFDCILLDPPAFIKKRKDILLGTKAYQRIHDLAITLLADDGILITSSCSMHLQREDLVKIAQRSAKNNHAFLQIIASGQQAPDHPIHPAISETNYLKTLFCRFKLNP